MQLTAPHATIEILQSSINLHGRTRRINCACTDLNECFIANALHSSERDRYFRIYSQLRLELLSRIDIEP